jgi:two-component system LytT family sensor kinase
MMSFHISKPKNASSSIDTFNPIGLVVGGWTVYGLFYAFQGYFVNHYFGRAISLTQNLAAWFYCALIWMLLSPVVYTLARRFSFNKEKLFVTIPVQIIAGACLSVTALTLFIPVRLELTGQPSSEFGSALGSLLVAEFHNYFVLYFILIGINELYSYYWRFREHQARADQLELEAAQLETQLAQAQLNALKMQIHPHFLFNTLNSISELVPRDPGAANEMLVRLSELLRVALRSGASQLIPLREELDFLRDYLAIEQMRFQDRLTVDFEVDEAVLDAEVPTLILQPLVENVILHGINTKPTTGRLQVLGRRINGFIEISISHERGAISVTSPPSNSGINNTRERLERLYGADQTFEIQEMKHNNWVRLVIKLPYTKDEQHDSSLLDSGEPSQSEL